MAIENRTTTKEGLKSHRQIGIDATNQISALADLLDSLNIEKMDSDVLENTIATIAARLRCLAQVAFFAVNQDEEFDTVEMDRRMRGV